MPRGSQLARQWRLLQLLDRPQGVTVEDAAEALGCAVRTVWRDLRVLEEAGFPAYTRTASVAYALRNPEFKAEVERRVPLGRVAEVDDVVGAAVFLASPPAGYMTGQTIFVDGGWLAQ